ncbi:hypothetical protein K438DRAFT_1797263 [Mycena galopus ATCC 62051]|nr:hypothetical protein K438DRAFT_1797263 [Mycena galopus ATCC 62051]
MRIEWKETSLFQLVPLLAADTMPMLPHALLFFVFTLGLSVSAASSTNGSSGTPSASASGASVSGSSNSIGTPSNSADLPSLSGVSSCVNTCLEVAVSADNCTSLAAVDCFCPDPIPYTKAFVSCLTACPSEVASAEALVEQFCAVAATPTSLSFPSFTPSSTSASASNSNPKSGSTSGSSSSSATAPPSSSSGGSSASTTSNAARMGGPAGMSTMLLQFGVSALGVLLGALVVL